MVTVLLEEKAVDAIRRALENEAFFIERRQRIAEIVHQVTGKEEDEVANLIEELFWNTQALLSLVNAETFREPDPNQMAWTAA